MTTVLVGHPPPLLRLEINLAGPDHDLDRRLHYDGRDDIAVSLHKESKKTSLVSWRQTRLIDCMTFPFSS